MIYKENEKAQNPLSTLNLVDDLQRLGVWYHFVDDISNVLDNVYNKYYKSPEKWNTLDLNVKALGFRILRHNGYHITQGMKYIKDVFYLVALIHNLVKSDIIVFECFV